MGIRPECFKQSHFIENPTDCHWVSIGINSNIKPLVPVSELYRNYNFLSRKRYCVKKLSTYTIGFSNYLPNYEGCYCPRLAYRDEGRGAMP